MKIIRKGRITEISNVKQRITDFKKLQVNGEMPVHLQLRGFSDVHKPQRFDNHAYN